MLQLVPMLARFTAEAPRLRLNAGVVLLPLLSPLHVAEEFATLDVMSGGKSSSVSGSAIAMSSSRRSACPGAARPPLRGQSYRGPPVVDRGQGHDEGAGHFELDEASCLPKPLQKPHPPIWVGANADPAIDRAARLGDCWYIGPAQDRDDRTPDGTLPARARRRRQAVPDELPMRREVFVARTRAEAIRLCAPYLGEKYKAYHAWGQDLPPDDSGFDQEFET